MDKREELALRAMQAQARFVGTCGYNSDILMLLARILAYYQIRGTSPEEMVESEALLGLIKNMVEEVK